jgi:hypothetical protein
VNILCKWTPDNWLTFSGVLVTFVGIIATAIFSYLLWRATERSTKAAESSASAAEASTRIALGIEKERERLARDIKEQLLIGVKREATEILSQLDQIRLFTVNNSFILRTVSPPITAINLAEYFPQNERNTIISAWENYRNMIDMHWVLRYTAHLHNGPEYQYSVAIPDDEIYKTAFKKLENGFLEVMNL